MLTIETAGIRIAADLEQAEALANECLRAHALLMTSMMNLRLETGVAPYEGQIAVSRVQTAMNKIVEAQGDLAKAHKSMREGYIKITGGPDDPFKCPLASLGKVTSEAA